MKIRLALCLLLLVPSVAAHAEPFASDPASGTRLPTAPSEVWVDFTEPVYRDGSWIRVVDQDGVRWDNNDLRIEGNDQPRMSISLKSDTPDGAYRIQWQTYSRSDGHTIQGAIGFAVGGFAPPETQTTDASDSDLRAATARLLLYAGFAMGIGAIAFAMAVRRDTLPHRRGTEVGAGLALLGTGLLLWDTQSRTGLSLDAFLASAGGNGMLARFALAGLLLAVVLLRPATPASPKVWSGALAGGWLLLALATSRFGHINREGSFGWMLEWTHLLAASVWIGTLFYFFLAIRGQSLPAIRELGARFTKLAQWAVLALIVTGVIISVWLTWPVLQARPGALSDAAWTWFLVTKIGATVTMLALAGVNRFIFLRDPDTTSPWTAWLPDWGQGSDRDRQFRRTVVWESGLSVIALMAAALLLTWSPPAAETDPGMVERTAQGDEFLGLLHVTPQPSVGASHTLRVFITDAETQEPLTNNTCGRDDCIRASWVANGDASTQQRAALVPEGDGWWRAEDILFSVAGQTAVSVEVQSAYVYLDTLEFDPFPVQ